MNTSFLSIGESKKVSSLNELESATIDWLRFPLALAVIFIHNFGNKGIDLDYIHSNPTSLESTYDFIRIFFSNIATHFSVPTFFMISGYLFFFKLNEWNMDIYKTKMLKRFKSLFIPYILWICIGILFAELPTLVGVFLKGEPISGLWKCLMENGGIRMFWDSRVWGLNYTNWFGHITPESSPILVPLWFVRDLMVVVLFTPIIYYFIRKMRFGFIIALGLCYLSGVFIPIHGFSACCFFWFSLGAYFSINRKCMVESLYKLHIPAYILTCLTLIPLVWFNGRKGDEIATNQLASVLYPIYAMGAVISSVSIASALLRLKIVGVNKKIAKATFFIFLSHIFILGYVKAIFDKIFPLSNYILQSVAYLASPIITAAICLLIFELMNKYMPKVLSLLVGSRT